MRAAIGKLDLTNHNTEMDLNETKWPQSEIEAKGNRQHYFQGSAICLRGHQYSTRLEPGGAAFVPEKCSVCGTGIFTKCPRCDFRIRGNETGNGYYTFEDALNPGFCDNCGHLFPWATREERIFELENRLESEEIRDDDRGVIKKELNKLINPHLSEEEEQKIWSRISEKAGKVLQSPKVMEIIEGIASKVIIAKFQL